MQQQALFKAILASICCARDRLSKTQPVGTDDSVCTFQLLQMAGLPSRHLFLQATLLPLSLPAWWPRLTGFHSFCAAIDQVPTFSSHNELVLIQTLILTRLQACTQQV